MSDKRFCAKCGTEIVAGNSFCTGCGSPVQEAPKSPPRETQQDQHVPPPSVEPQVSVPPQIGQGGAAPPPPTIPSGAYHPPQTSAPNPVPSVAPHQAAFPVARKPAVGLIVLLVVLGVIVLGGGGYWAYSTFFAKSGFSVADGKVSLDVPDTWSLDSQSEYDFMVSKDTGTGTGYRVVVLLTDATGHLPIPLEDLHAQGLYDIEQSAELESGFESVEDETRTLPNGMTAMISVIREADIEDPLYYYTLTAIHNGKACWLQVISVLGIAEEVDAEAESIVDSLRMDK